MRLDASEQLVSRPADQVKTPYPSGASALRILIPALALTLMASNAFAQSIVTGAITGTVLDEFGRPMPDVHVVLTEPGTGLQRDRETGDGGQFDFLFLSAGSYEVFAEQLGYRPGRVRGIPVSISLAPAPPPVDSVHVDEFAGRTFELVGTSWARVFSDLEIGRVPGRSRELAELARFSSVSDGALGIEGLPPHLAGVLIDGVPYGAASNHPELPHSGFATAPFPYSQFASAELLAGGVDVEYAGFAGALVSGRTVRGTRRLKVRGFTDWSNEGLASSAHFDPGSISHAMLRGGLVVTGPVIRDTAHFVIGAEARRLETPLPRAWTATGLDSAVLAVASDSFGVDLVGYTKPRLVSTDLVSAFGRFDGQVSERSAVTLRANFARFSVDNPQVVEPPFVGLGAQLEGTDAHGAVQFTSSLSAAIGMELRMAMEYSERELRSSNLPGTVLAEGPIAFGDDPALAGRFERLVFRASETFHFRLGAHRLKLGGSAMVGSFDQAFVFGRGGEFAFGSVSDFAGLNGSFVQSVGPSPNARFNTSEFGGFVQDRWSATPGLELTFGFRLDAEFLSSDDVLFNEAWFDQTGLTNNEFNRTITKFSPRFGFRWDVGNRHRWLIRAQAGIHHGTMDPGSFAEVVTQSGTPLLRRGVGDLGRWVETPDSNAAPVRGPSLSLPGRNFEAPRTFRTSLGVRVALGGATQLDVSVAYRHTELLLRRRDLNLATAPSGRDQFGRPVYGSLVQSGSALFSEPGTNRRFSGFDLVSSLDADGVSDYWGLTARLESRLGRWLNLVGSYTYSQTNDNFQSDGGPPVELTPFPTGLNDRDWLDSRSDFDVPHRAAIGAELHFAVFSLAGFYRHQSGLPFTPGFRVGVDANGDGSSRNDPAFVDDELSGVADLLSGWDCLRVQVGRFAERNSCRGDPTNTLDVRVAIRVFQVAGYDVEVMADGLNLLDPRMAELDRALYLVDPSGSLATDPVTGNVTVPLIANPNFGRPAQLFSTGRFIRFGIRVGS